MIWTQLKERLPRWWPHLPLALTLAAALALRLYGIDWDQGNFLHPDERSIYMRVKELGWPSSLSQFLDADRSPLNPHWFPLGSIILYMLLIVDTVTSPLVEMDLSDLRFAGRAMAALADTAAVFLVFALASHLYGRRVGLLAAALAALAVIHIQNGHIYRPEAFIALFVLASFIFMFRVLARGRLRDSLLLGLFVGLAFASKVSVLPILLPLGLTYFFRLNDVRRSLAGVGGGSNGATNPTTGEMAAYPSASLWMPALRAVLPHLLLAGLVAAVTYLLWVPYSILALDEFLDWNLRENRIARTAGIMPYTIQYIGSTRFWYEIRQSSLWGLGLPLGIAAWGGLLFCMAMAWKYRDRRYVLLLAWVIPSFLVVGSYEVKFLRYVFPIIPFLIIMGSRMLFSGLDWVKAQRPHLSGWAVAAIALVVASTAFYALAFEAIYTRPHTAVQASRWINANVPFGSTILTDNHWDEGIPDLGRYRVRQVPIYEGDSVAKIEKMAQDLSQGDYLIFYSNRTYGSITRVPERYPYSARYYQLLFSGQLGYRLESQFTSYPSFLGIAFVDDTYTRPGLPEPAGATPARPAPITLNLGYADENVIDYDHPKVLLFRNVDRLSAAELTSKLFLEEGGFASGKLLLSEQERAAQEAGGTWSGIIQPQSWASRVPVLAWLLLAELLGLAALPLAFVVFSALPTRGLLLAKPLGILLASYIVWLMASTHAMAFARGSILAALLLVAGLSALVLAVRWRQFVAFVRAHWRLLAVGEALFLAAYLSFVAVRAANPDLWHPFRGGEKPMDFAYLNGILRSTYMPPYDPWYAGGYLNYFYWGHFIVAVLIKATGIQPAVAFNLAVPFLFALTLTSAFAVTYNLALGLHRSRAGGTPGRASLPTGPLLAGLAGALFVAVISNLDGAVQLVQGAGRALQGDGFPAFDFWRSSRMIPPLENVDRSPLRFWVPATPQGSSDVSYHITEFPFFTFLFADLHAHLIVIPFALMLLALALNMVLALRQGWRLAWLPGFLVLALTLGAVFPSNTWDYPPYALLSVAALALGTLLSQGHLGNKLRLLVALAVGVVALSYLAFLPFHLRNETFDTGLAVSKWQTPLYSYLGVHGLFVFLIGSFLIYQLRGALAQGGRRLLAAVTPRPAQLWNAAGQRAAQGVAAWPWGLTSAALLGVLLLFLAAGGYWTAAVLTALLALVALEGQRLLRKTSSDTPYQLFPLLLVAYALLIGIGVDFVHMKGDIGRMNTLFKLYLEAWLLLAIASAYALWRLSPLLGRVWAGRAPVGTWVWAVGLALLLFSSLIYTVLGTRARLADRFNVLPLTLDGAAYMEKAQHQEQGQPLTMLWDADAIRWLQENVEGSPVVLEAVLDQYRWGGRISAYTGLPTVLGWPWHQIQQKGPDGYTVFARRSLVEEIYSTPSAERALELMRQYRVRYVVVGELERVVYPALGLSKFDQMGGLGVTLAYTNPGVKIYRVHGS